jgi:hypothetical protein
MKQLLLSFCLLFCFSFKHPFYLSVTDLKYNEKEKSIQDSVKIFTNDLEGALKKKLGRTVDLINIKDKGEVSRIMKDYLNEHLRIFPDGEPKNYELIGFEKEEEATWFYIELKNCSRPKTIKIENSVLYDFIKEQMNIVHIELNGEKKSYKVNYPEKEIRFEF